MTNIPENQVEFKKKVGKIKDQAVYHIKTRGGLHIIAKTGGEIIGSGNHRAVARHIAQKYEPDVVWTELSKSDWYPVDSFQHLLPEAETTTADLRRLQAEKKE